MLHEKNNFTEESKNLTRYSSENNYWKIIIENNYIGYSNVMNNAAKSLSF